MTTVAPNPHSPYANANPEYRHIFPSPIFFPTPNPGVLAPAACELMAVVPADLIETEPGAALPDGLCPDCVAVMQGGAPPKHPSSRCGECDAATWHGALCALCRQEKHDEWWPTREGSSFVKPADRPAEWARMAAEFAAEGRSHAEIAVALCVDESTVARLLASDGAE